MSLIITNGALYKQELVTSNIPPGIYTLVHENRNNTTSLENFVVNSDQVVDVDSTQYTNIVAETTLFFTNETKEKFNKYGFLYKKSILLHGKPGIGKTCTIVRLLKEFQSHFKNGIVLFNPDIFGLDDFNKVTSSETPVLIVFEEFEEMFKSLHRERLLLSLLDGQAQRPNTVFICTTNFIKEIPPRILRPGRISNIINIGLPDTKARASYLIQKMPEANYQMILQWSEATKGFTIDDLKQLVLLVNCLDVPFKNAIKRIHDQKETMNENELAQEQKLLKEEEEDETW